MAESGARKEWEQAGQTTDDTTTQAKAKQKAREKATETIKQNTSPKKVWNVLTSKGCNESIEDIERDFGVPRWKAHGIRAVMHVTGTTEGNALTDIGAAILHRMKE